MHEIEKDKNVLKKMYELICNNEFPLKKRMNE